MNGEVVVYDIETLASCFTYSSFNINTGEVEQYVIHKDRNDLEQLLDHFKKCSGQIGFNNIAFDYPIIHNIIKNSELFLNSTEEFTIFSIYDQAQNIISNQNNMNNSNIVWEKNMIIPQLDLYKVWHYNNKARSTSLKSLEVSMNYPNVMEMPIHHNKLDISLKDIDSILEYNLNDVMATYEFYKLSLDKIDLRKSLSKTYNISCRNWSDSRIGEELILKLYCQKTSQDIKEVKEMRSNRLKIALNEVILPSISFKSKEFNTLLDKFKCSIISETKGSIEESVIYKGFKYDYGTGGIHGCIKSGIYESDDDYMIIDADVGSLYPNIAITNEFYPEHLGKNFIIVYNDIIELRMQAKKAGNSVLSDGFKLAANSVYGKSNDVNSFLYDPKFTMQITLNGQLLLTILIESLVNGINDLQMLQVNTDGITVKIHKKDLDLYYSICKIWEKETKLNLEYVEYEKMVIGDVNNYLAISTKGKIKNKGRFEVDKVVGNEKAYHKDNSFRIIPLALQEFFVNNTPIEDTIKNHKNIYDFCGRQKFKGDDYGFINTINNNQIIKEKQQKVTRYYISNKGSSFIKHYAKGSIEIINKGYQVTIFNKYENKQFDSYDINYNYYIKECNKELNNIINKQLEMF